MDLGGIRLLRNMEKRAITAHIRGLVNELVQILISNDENIHQGHIGLEGTHHSSFVKGDLGHAVKKMNALDLKRSKSPAPIIREEENRTSFRLVASPQNIHRRLSPERFIRKPQGI